MPDLLPCPFDCGVYIRGEFENLRDDEETEPPTPCWTIKHRCPVINSTIWVSAESPEACRAAWNTRVNQDEARDDNK